MSGENRPVSQCKKITIEVPMGLFEGVREAGEVLNVPERLMWIGIVNTGAYALAMSPDLFVQRVENWKRLEREGK